MEIIHFFDTHVYPECVVVLSFKHPEDTELMAVKAEFNDGVYANARIEFVNLEELKHENGSYLHYIAVSLFCIFVNIFTIVWNNVLQA